MPVVHVQETDDRPGGAANVAVNLASLGVDTRLVGVVGEDEAADALRSILKAKGIRCDFHGVADRPTITKTRVQSRGQQLIRLDQENASAVASADVFGILNKAIEGAGEAAGECVEHRYEGSVGRDGRPWRTSLR